MDEQTTINQLSSDRERIIVRTSIIGITTNIFLVIFKAIVGILSHSIAVILDAVNNLSDALSSVITIIGAKLAGKAPNKKHPLGYGRIEYLSSMIVSAIVLYAGFTSFLESAKKIITPDKPDYSIMSLIIIAVAIVVKLILGYYVKKQGEKVNSGALVASGSDASFDAVLSFSVLVSAIIFMIWKISLEAYVGIVISAVIIKSGIEMMAETLDDILGKRTDKAVSDKIKDIITSEEKIIGAYDLIINNYGPNKNYASVHIELPDTMTVKEVDEMTRKIELNVYKHTGVILTGVGVYSYNTTNEEAAKIRNHIQNIVMSHDWALQMHGFYADTDKKSIRFDTVISFDVTPKEAVNILNEEIQRAYPDYKLEIVTDVDIVD